MTRRDRLDLLAASLDQLPQVCRADLGHAHRVRATSVVGRFTSEFGDTRLAMIGTTSLPTSGSPRFPRPPFPAVLVAPDEKAYERATGQPGLSEVCTRALEPAATSGPSSKIEKLSWRPTHAAVVLASGVRGTPVTQSTGAADAPTREPPRALGGLEPPEHLIRSKCMEGARSDVARHPTRGSAVQVGGQPVHREHVVGPPGSVHGGEADPPQLDQHAWSGLADVDVVGERH